MSYFDVRSQENMKAAVRRKNPAPCKNCEDRHEACHPSCEKYSTWQESLRNDMSDFCKKYAKENSGATECKRRFQSKNIYRRVTKGQATPYDYRTQRQARKKTN